MNSKKWIWQNFGFRDGGRAVVACPLRNVLECGRSEREKILEPLFMLLQLVVHYVPFLNLSYCEISLVVFIYNLASMKAAKVSEQAASRQQNDWDFSLY